MLLKPAVVLIQPAIVFTLKNSLLRRAIKANRITCHYDSEGEYAEPLREARQWIQRPIFYSTSFNNINLKLQQLVSNR
jgi:hypothetical protein